MLLIKSVGPLDIWLTLTISNDFTHASTGDFTRHSHVHIISSRSFAINNEELSNFAYLCNFIFHNGMPLLQRRFCIHCLVTLTHTGLWIAFLLFPTTSKPVPFHECIVQFFSCRTRKWELEARKDECNVFYCCGIGSFVNTPETQGKEKREVNKSVEAKDAIYMFLSVRSHY